MLKKYYLKNLINIIFIKMEYIESFDEEYNYIYIEQEKLLNLKVKAEDIKKMIKSQSGISETMWDIKFIPIELVSMIASKYRVRLKRNLFETMLTLDVNKTI